MKGWSDVNDMENIPTGPRRNHYVAMVVACIFWGASFVVTKHLLGILSPMLLVFSRFFIGTLVVLVLGPILRPRSISRSDLKLFIFMSVFEPGLYFLFETYGIARTDPTSAALIIASIPVLVIVIAHFTSGEVLTAAKVAGAVVSITGVVLVTSGAVMEKGATAVSTLLGNVAVFAAAMTAACFTVLLSKLAKRYSPITITRFQIYFAAIFFAPLGIPQLKPSILSAIGVADILLLLFLAIFPGIAAFFLYNHALSKIEAGRASIFINTIPLFTALTAWIFLGQGFSWEQVSGGLLILGGVVIANRSLSTQPLA